MRKILPALALAVTVALVGGCGGRPSQLAAAAIVGGTVISLEDVHDRVQTALRDPQTAEQIKQQKQLDALTSNVVSASVLHDLLEEAARRQHLTVTDQQVTDALTAAGGAEAASNGLIYDASSIRERVRDQLLGVALGNRYFDHLVVTVDLAGTQDRQHAEALARQIADHPDRVTQILGSDPAVAGSRSGLMLRAGSDPGTATTVVFGLPPGNVAVFQPQGTQGGQGGWFVVYVRSRSIDAPAPAAGDGSVQLASQVDIQTMEAIGQRLLQPLATELGIRINPRYGVWDPVQLRVVPAQESAGEIVPVRAGAS